MSNATNPFEEFDNNDNDYDSSLDPFAETTLHVDHSLSSKGRENSIEEIISTGNDCSTPILSTSYRASDGFLNDCSSVNSLSRLSLTSNTSNTIAEQQLKQYSIGDGNLQKEGLLCPECMAEYKTITELANHFEKEHERRSQRKKSWSNFSPLSKQIFSNISTSTSSSSFPIQMGGQIKGLLNKFLNNKQIFSINSSTRDPTHSDFYSYDNIMQDTTKSWSEQSQQLLDPTTEWKHFMHQGPRRSHFEYYSCIRDQRIERYVFETNKLLILLDKLLYDYPPLTDWDKRRKHEQSIVEWVDETIVPLCPSCGTKFNLLTRKRHHCRLCGAVMCTKCSEFISFSFAYELITPVSLDSSNSCTEPHTKESIQREQNTMDVSPLLTFMKNINTPLVDQENLDKLRVCRDCKLLLVIRKEKMEVVHLKAPIEILYEQLSDMISQIDHILPIYYRMTDSINMGESNYQLKDAHELKQKLIKLSEQADIFSRKIESFGINVKSQTAESEYSNTSSISSRQLSLQTSIRRSTIHYLRQNLLGLPELPDEERFEELKKRHVELIEKRIHLEKQMALMEQEKFQQIRDKKPITQSMITIGDNEDGFCPQISNGTQLWQNMNDKERMAILEEKDPMVQQMNIIRSYIRQAKNDNRYEEVAMLEENLKELEIEFYLSQQQQKQQSGSNSLEDHHQSVAMNQS